MENSYIQNTLNLSKLTSDQNQINKLQQQLSAKGADATAIKKTSEEFEAVFIAQMLKNIFDTVEPDPLFNGGKGEEIFKSMSIDEYGKLMSSHGGIGVADHVAKEMLKLQEVGNHENHTA